MSDIRVCPCGHVLYPNESVLCEDCINRIDEEVAAEIFLEDLGVQEPIIPDKTLYGENVSITKQINFEGLFTID